MAQTKAANRLKAITKKARSIRRQHPRMKWQSAMKQAGKKYKK